MHKEFQLTPRLTFLLAVTSATAVANLYYAQPLLHKLAGDLHTTDAKVSFVITASQIGYALGLLFLLPLGDLVRRKQLIVAGLFSGSLALFLISFSKSLLLFEGMSLIVGLSSVVAQVVIPLAADLASPEKAGKTVGTVMGGLLSGILLARTFSGIIADALGIPAVFLIAALLMTIMGIVLQKVLPDIPPKIRNSSIWQILKSSISIFIRYRALQLRALYGMLTFAAFSLLWTSLSFYLAGPTYKYSSRVIGMFGLLGIVGVVAARLAGVAADRGRVQLTTVLGGLVVTLTYIELHLFGNNLLLLALGIVIVDAAIQSIHISNQSIIYKVLPSARSRINSTYMTMYFIGGGIGSAISGLAWQQGGWPTITLIGSGIGALLVAVWLFEKIAIHFSSA